MRAAAVLCIVAADVGAYVVGKSMGKTQLIAISPKKTVEGAISGLLCSVAVALLARAPAPPPAAAPPWC